MSHHAYVAAERGGDVPTDLGLAQALDYKPELYEKCVIARRRKGLTQLQLARKLKCCKHWVTQMELGLVDCSRLVEYWDKHPW